MISHVNGADSSPFDLKNNDNDNGRAVRQVFFPIFENGKLPKSIEKKITKIELLDGQFGFSDVEIHILEILKLMILRKDVKKKEVNRLANVFFNSLTNH